MIKILFIHGVGFQEEDKSWEALWTRIAKEGIRKHNSLSVVETDFFDYDDAFKQNNADTSESVAAVGGMLWNWTIAKLGFRRNGTRGFARDIWHDLESKPGMVAEWGGDAPLRKLLRERLGEKIAQFRPDVIAAHSLGSLIAYDWLRQSKNQQGINNLTFLTYGSQIANPALASIFGGQILIPPVRRWINLYNKQDKVLVEPIRLNSPVFKQVTLNDAFGHDGAGYLGAEGAVEYTWKTIAATYDLPKSKSPAKSFAAKDTAAIGRIALASKVATRKGPTRKALLVGINRYTDSRNNLEGCVNDVFLMSATLQECGFDADEIRIVLDERATAMGIRDRLEWLLEDASGEDERFFFYSGHGAQMPSYGGDEIPERVDECLVPHDFHWTEDSAIIDDWFYGLYRNLPYTTRFVAMLDCCHSGGMAREGGCMVRGITPPDDIRHRAMRWDTGFQMWVPRERFAADSTPGDKLPGGDRLLKNTTVQTTRSLGSGDVGRISILDKASKKAAKVKGKIATEPYGPFQPLLLKACRKNELAREYRHGAESYGAFTYCMTRLLRQGAGRISYGELIEKAGKQLQTLGFTQHPGVEGPDVRRDEIVPWQPAKLVGKRLKK